MKKAVLFIAALATSAMLMAQEKGELSLTGNFLISGGNTVVSTNIDGHMTIDNTPAPMTFNLGAGIGYFVADNVEIGICIYYGLNREKNDFSTSENAYHSSVSSFTIKPEISYYVPLVLGKFFWAPAFELGFKSMASRVEVNNETIDKGEKLPFQFTAGLDLLSFEIRPWKHLAFDFSFGGLYYNSSIRG